MKAWRNTLLRFGLVAVPVSLTPAKSDKSAVTAHHYDPVTKSRASQAWTVDGETILPETSMFYDVGGVPVAADVDENYTKEITLEGFVSEGTIDPLFYDAAYCLFAGKGGEDGLGLIARVLRDNAFMTFAGTAVFTDRPRSVVIRWSDAAGCLILHTLTFTSRVRFADMRTAAEGLAEPSAELLAQAGMLTDALPSTFLPLDEDAHERAIVSALAKSAPKGTEIPVPLTTAGDILASLRADMEGRARAGTKGTTKPKRTKVSAS